MVVARAGQLISRMEFVPAEISPFADTVRQLVEGGWLKATSVGFRPLEWKFNEQRGGFDFTKQELLEFSIVPVPANPEARLRALLSAAVGGGALAPGEQGAGKSLVALADEQLAAIEAAVSKTLTKLLSTDPGSELHRLIADVVEAAQAGGGHTCPGDDDHRKTAPGTGDQQALERAVQVASDTLRQLRS
jgi:hypothetical protein